MPEQPKLIEYRNIYISQNGTRILHNINLSIGLGEDVAILGPNGAGKTFFIRTITRESYPEFGIPDSRMLILGQESWNVFELRKLLGVVTDSMLHGRMRAYSGREVILSGFFSSTGIWPGRHIVTEEMERKTAEVMERLQITHLAERPINEVSTGEARRVLIGRALVHDPRALVLDEPNSSLDLRASRELRQMLREIAGAGTSIIMVTHDLEDVIPEISRVIMLKQGAVFKDGPKDEVLTSETLSELFGIPLELKRRDGSYYIT